MGVADFLSTCNHVERASIAKPKSDRRIRRYVYFLILKGSVVYVGSTDDVEIRLRQHLGSGRHSDRWVKEFDSAKWFECSVLPAQAYEGALIRSLNPKYNYGSPAEHEIGDAAVLERIGLTANPSTATAFAFKRRPSKIRREASHRSILRGQLWRSVCRILKQESHRLATPSDGETDSAESRVPANPVHPAHDSAASVTPQSPTATENLLSASRAHDGEP